MEKILPCPFCGSDAHIAESGKNDYIYILCDNCLADMGPHNSKDEAIKAWNTRVDRWISVEDRLPEDRQYVLVDPPYVSGAFKDEPRHVLFWNKRLCRFQYYLGGSIHNAFDVTSWMSIPEPPGVEGRDGD